MAVNPSPLGPKPQFELAAGTPAVGYKLFFYVAGSVNTKQNTYTDSTGLTANTNPVVLNSLGQPTTQIWFTSGQSYKVVFAPDTDTDPPTSPVWTIDNLTGVNDVTLSQSEWVAGPAPTYISATSFSLAGDQTSTFTKGRRVKTTNSGGTVYSTITNTSFGVVTTVTVANDSSTLDSGLSAVSYGLISAVNPTIDADMIHRKGAVVASAATTDIWGIAGDYAHVSGVATITSLGTAPYAGAERVVIFDGALVLTHNATTLVLPSGINIKTAANDRMTVRADTTANMVVTSYTKASGTAVDRFPQMHIAGLTYANNGTDSLDIAAGSARDATNTVDMVFAALTKQTQNAWAVGSAAGSLDTGAVGNSDYYLWIIKRSDTGVVDALSSLSSTAPTMPANYDYKRLIGWFKRVGGVVVAFHTYELEGGGIELAWDAPTIDVNLAATLTTARRTDAVKVPLNFSVMALLNVFTSDAGSGYSVGIACPDQTDAAVGAGAPLCNLRSNAAGSAAELMWVRTSAAGLIAARADLATVDVYSVGTVALRWARRN